ncbi:MAG: ImmA/IrrE family metallo-endopeptidase [Chloroflexota bacterium]
MPVDLSLLGEKISKYRGYLQVSLSDVATATGIPEEALASFEIGSRAPSGDEVLILADYFKCDFRFFISDERIAPFEQTETLYRKYGESFSKEDRWAVQEFLFLCECEQHLLDLLGRASITAFQFKKVGGYFKNHGEQAAHALRRALGYEPHAVGMNVYNDFRRIGLHVFRRQLGNSDISGLYIKHPSAGKCVLINYSEDVYRQRFTGAHEAAHAILDDEDVVVSFEHDRWNKKNLSEIRANTFASRYLMPPEFLRSVPEAQVWDGGKILDWANRLETNPEALSYALKDARLVSAETAAQLKLVRIPASLKVDPELPADLSLGSRRRREEMLRRGLSVFYVGLCFDGYSAGAISAARLAEMLLVDPHQVVQVAEVFGRALQ